MRTRAATKWTLASVALLDAYTDFVLSRQAKQCSPATLQFYKFTAGAFLRWIESQGVISPEEVTARHVRQYLAGITGADTSKHDHARAIRTLLRFWHAEKYMPDLVTFDMPKVAQKRLPVLSVDELRQVIEVCNIRDKALVMLIVDSGLRRAEVCALNWDDLDFSNGLIRVRRGKGGKARSAVIGAVARRALLAYRRLSPRGDMSDKSLRAYRGDGQYPERKGDKTLTARNLDNLSQNSEPMFISQKKGRLTHWGMGLIFSRLSKRTGIHVTAHTLRRTFVILSLRAGMSPTHLQALGGWSGLEMVSHYAQLEDVDLLQAHQEHGPLDGII